MTYSPEGEVDLVVVGVPVASTPTWVGRCGSNHDGVAPVMIGGFAVHLTASGRIADTVLDTVDVVYPLNGSIPTNTFFGQFLQVVECELRDRGGVPKEWDRFIRNTADLIRAGKKIAAWCTGSHGRTGTFGASLIAVMEPDIEDPIAEIRKRHCVEAVETLDQAKAVFSLKGVELPEVYKAEFAPKPFTHFPSHTQVGLWSQADSLPAAGSMSYAASPKVKPSRTIVPPDGVMIGGIPWEDHYDWCLCEVCVEIWTSDKAHKPDKVATKDCECKSCVIAKKKEALAEARTNPTKFHFGNCDCIFCKPATGGYKPDPNKPHPTGCVCSDCIKTASDLLDGMSAFSSTV